MTEKSTCELALKASNYNYSNQISNKLPFVTVKCCALRRRGITNTRDETGKLWKNLGWKRMMVGTTQW